LRFDLVIIRNREIQKVGEDGKKEKTGEFKDFEEDFGYDMNFDTCIDRIVKAELANNESTVDLNTFLTEYNRIKEELLTEIKIK
jgi:hypothetical protein